MNILFLTLLDFDSLEEQGIYTDLMREFSLNNHEVYIVSPVEKKRQKNTYLIDEKNVKILKVQIGNVQKTNMIEKGISLLLLNRKFKNSIREYFSGVKFDLIIYATPPITLVNTINFIVKRDRAKSYLLLKDIFPQNAVDLEMISKKGLSRFIYSYFRWKEKELYKISDHIGCMSLANVKYILKENKTVDSDKVEICPNTISPLNIDISDVDKMNIKQKYKLPLNKTIFIYGGNLGKPQGIDFIIECLRKNEENDNSFILIIGSGTEYDKLHKIFEQEHFNNAKLMHGLPKHEYEMLASSCDVGLVFLDHRFTIPNFPSRILSYMQAAMPIIVSSDRNTDIGKITTEGKFGYSCSSQDIEGFNVLLGRLNSKTLRTQMGKNSRQYLENNYNSKVSYSIIMKHFMESESD
ncbi:glycosyltransferase WbuB [Exiguobacterium sp. SH1S21]|uniref:glycosyltransferase family 4 protein n=1 Tax=Exiguobacterium sp. SH1S21 TaxID=2510953 RepID=UPI001039EE4F|nr:glycosyltransferase family 4 protein [Exiguobacterium sp. SH1S21]TCI57453.1 glycosyltransferase WbuB [Exiguobacterium sp. SH1S21]